ncbi:MAG: ABC transporter ATP-binding protein [Clostridiales bacterium]|nr:ABC transporter ATP-binding protein [Clostridiales bacterium]
MSYFETKDLSVGYHGKALIHDICLSLKKGEILTLIGPNGAGKSTILKSVARQLQTIRGSVYVQDQDICGWNAREAASHLAVVLTDRIHPELMTCRELVAMGRYPYTNAVGRLTEEDRRRIEEALTLVQGEELAERDFMTLSDGQKQRILLARAICQDTEILVLDEPTSYLDIRYQVEVLQILRRLAREKGMTILLSMQEIDLAYKFSDRLLCVKGDTIFAFGDPEEILNEDTVRELYGMEQGYCDVLLGSVELPRVKGNPQVFVIGGAGYGIPVYRKLQREEVPFAAGILFENDVDYAVARGLASVVFSTGAFEPAGEEIFLAAKENMLGIGTVIDAGCPVRSYNQCNEMLLAAAREAGIRVIADVSEIYSKRL